MKSRYQNFATFYAVRIVIKMIVFFAHFDCCSHDKNTANLCCPFFLRVTHSKDHAEITDAKES